MGYVVNPDSGILTLKFSLIKNDLAVMGSVPIPLPGTDLMTSSNFFIPFSAFFVWTAGTTAYDFNNADHPVIADNTGGYGIYWKWYEPLQIYGGTNNISIALTPQRTHSQETFAKLPELRTLGDVPLRLTTATGNDATTGNMDFDLYLTFFKIPR